MNSVTNPYSTYSTNAAPKLNMSVQTQVEKNKKEEEAQKSPKRLPHTAEPLQEYISQMYINLMEIKHIVIQTEKEPNVKRKDIDEVLQIIDEIGQRITMDLSNSIDKLYI